MVTKCKAGEIKRKGYVRNGTYVKPACIMDRGKKGKGPKILPPINEVGLLRKYGYSTKLSNQKRELVLRRASREETPLKLLRHLNLIANYSADDRSKKIMRKDVDYLSGLHEKYKARMDRSKGSKKIGSRKGSKKIGSRKGSKKIESRKGSKKIGSGKGSKKRGSRKRSKKNSSRKGSKRRGSRKRSKKRSRKH